jgi:hypothetical protein
MNNVMEPIVTISLAIVSLATLAVLVSRNANTSGVITAYGKTFASMVGAATAPVSGTTSMSPTGFNLPSPILGGGYGMSL